ncbi:nucleotidyltransferase domain-containing protein [Actinomadura xylanilytica]|uniref:nucleotidyltransferase domain-containing protein n=1 Tax=Actinomadura xylanilytica TaxID=887459 RepID=UPI00255AF33B|nr:amino acid transporter [Actinomadura xylanilytica]MDL4773862.1 amino acid transporter [Actinomadura xylanilytica]
MPHTAPWDPAPLAEVAALFASLAVPWWIAGGHAIDLAIGRVHREHADIDVLLLRRDQLSVQDALPAWQWWAADPPGTLRPWDPGETLPPSVHDIWCRPGPAAPWRIQVMFDESEHRTWISHRDDRIRRPIEDLGLVSPDGVPYLSPEVQLFYKARAPRPKDELDFAVTLPVLTGRQRRWLAAAIVATLGGHPWLDRLPEPGDAS